MHGNLLIFGSKVKLADYGLARGRTPGVSQPRRAAGTLAFAAPEVFQDQLQDRFLRQFSLAVTYASCAAAGCPSPEPPAVSPTIPTRPDTSMLSPPERRFIARRTWAPAAGAALVRQIVVSRAATVSFGVVGRIRLMPRGLNQGSIEWYVFALACWPETRQLAFRRVVALHLLFLDRPRLRRRMAVGDTLPRPTASVAGIVEGATLSAGGLRRSRKPGSRIPACQPGCSRYGCSSPQAAVGWSGIALVTGGVARSSACCCHRTGSCPPICRYTDSCRSPGVCSTGIGLTTWAYESVARPEGRRGSLPLALCSTLSLA